MEGRGREVRARVERARWRWRIASSTEPRSSSNRPRLNSALGARLPSADQKSAKLRDRSLAVALSGAGERGPFARLGLVRRPAQGRGDGSLCRREAPLPSSP